MTEFEAFKIFLVDHTGLAKDALHIYVSLAVYLGSCLIFRWKTRQWQPWCQQYRLAQRQPSAVESFRSAPHYQRAQAQAVGIGRTTP